MISNSFFGHELFPDLQAHEGFMRSSILRISFRESNSDLICLSIRYIRFVLRLFLVHMTIKGLYVRKTGYTNFLWIYKQFFCTIDSMNLYGILNLNKIAESE